MIGFKRPEFLEKLLSNVEFGSRRIYISIDAARNIEEARLVEESKKVVKAFQSKANANQIQLNFREVNQGLSEAVISAINWAFEGEEKLIILEDDVFPSKKFFEFMDHHLDEHQDNMEIWQVGGHNPNPRTTVFTKDYLSIFPMIWGWGTWQDRWAQYDREPLKHQGQLLSNVKEYADSKILSPEFEHYWEGRIKLLSMGFDTWDFQWAFSMWKQKSFSIQPALSLTLNIGQNAHGTNTTSSSVFITRDKLTIRRAGLPSKALKRSKFQDAVTWGFVFGRSKELPITLRVILKAHKYYRYSKKIHLSQKPIG